MSFDNLLRKQLRQSLIARREALSADERAVLEAQLGVRLLALLEQIQPHSLGFCWPYRGEPGIVTIVSEWLAADTARQAALPVVPDKPGPLQFRHWHPGMAMQPDRFRI